MKSLKRQRFWHQGVPVQFKGIVTSGRRKTQVNESEMSFMRYDDEDDETPDLTGSLRMEL